jgi:hypothetical protein
MTQGGEGSNLKWILGLVAHMSVFAMFAAFLPLGGEMLWWLVIPPVLLLIIGAMVASRADDGQADTEQTVVDDSADETTGPGRSTGSATGGAFDADPSPPPE